MPQLFGSPTPHFSPVSSRCVVWTPASETRPALPEGCLVASTDSLRQAPPQAVVQLMDRVLSGATLGLVVTRTGDLEALPFPALLGGTPRVGTVPVELIESERTEPGLDATPPGGRSASPPPVPANGGQDSATVLPGPQVVKSLLAYEGGNLHRGPFGSAASYGLGELHLLAFDPMDPGVASDPWVVRKMDGLAGSADQRKSLIAGHPGRRPQQVTIDSPLVDLLVAPHPGPGILTLLVLVLWASSAASLLVMWRGSPRGSPIRLLSCQLIATIAGGLAAISLVLFGSAVRNAAPLATAWRGRMDHTAFIEVAAGLSRGRQITWEVVTTPFARSLPPSATEPDRPLGPFEPSVVRTDSLVDLGGTVTLRTDAGGTTIVNHTPYALRDLVLFEPKTHSLHHAKRLASEASLLFAAAPRLSRLPHLPPEQTPTSLELEMNLTHVGSNATTEDFVLLDRVADSLGAVGWWPSDVPAALGFVEGMPPPRRVDAIPTASTHVILRVLGEGEAR